MSSGDLDELRNLASLESKGNIKLFVSDAVHDEFTRNRERVIAESLTQFKKSKFELHRPNIIRPHVESVELEHLQSRIRELTKTIVDRVTAEAVAGETTADRVVQELFDATAIYKVDSSIIDTAIHRTTLRKPPGKNDSCGDAIHWEWLLAHVPDNEDLHIISRDGDFESKLSEGSLDSYLASEWAGRKSSTCHLYLSLSSFLNQHFADIKLADQLAKGAAIEKLEQSSNFATTHNAIARLTQFDDFTAAELLRIIEAYKSNNQINWILADDDVKEFAHKLVTMAFSNDLNDAVFPIEVMLNKLELQEMP
ncbi:MAG: PIN domain-containing protein [Pirellulales bacterium]